MAEIEGEKRLPLAIRKWKKWGEGRGSRELSLAAKKQQKWGRRVLVGGAATTIFAASTIIAAPAGVLQKKCKYSLSIRSETPASIFCIRAPPSRSKFQYSYQYLIRYSSKSRKTYLAIAIAVVVAISPITSWQSQPESKLVPTISLCKTPCVLQCNPLLQ